MSKVSIYVCKRILVAIVSRQFFADMLEKLNLFYFGHYLFVIVNRAVNSCHLYKGVMLPQVFQDGMLSCIKIPK